MVEGWRESICHADSEKVGCLVWSELGLAWKLRCCIVVFAWRFVIVTKKLGVWNQLFRKFNVVLQVLFGSHIYLWNFCPVF